MRNNTVLDTLSETLQELSKKENEQNKLISDHQYWVNNSEGCVQTAKERQSCAAHEAKVAADKHRDFLEYINSLPQDQRPSVLYDKLTGLNDAHSKAIAGLRKADDVLAEQEEYLSQNKAKMAVAQNQLEEIKAKCREITNQIALITRQSA